MKDNSSQASEGQRGGGGGGGGGIKMNIKMQCHHALKMGSELVLVYNCVAKPRSTNTNKDIMIENEGNKELLVYIKLS